MANCISRATTSRARARPGHVAASPSSARWPRAMALSIVSKSCHGHRDESGRLSHRDACDARRLGAYACSESLYRVSAGLGGWYFPRPGYKCHPRGRCKTRPVIDLLRFVFGLAADLVRRRVELVADRSEEHTSELQSR